MIPILSNEQIRMVEGLAIRDGVRSALDLMETAGCCCAERILKWEAKTDLPPNYVIVAGQGNNGGDGAVIARYLAEAGRQVRLIVLEHRVVPSREFLVNTGRLEGTTVHVELYDGLNSVLHISDNDVIIDCILGSGASRELTGVLADVVADINRTGRPVVSIDLPSGVLEGGNSGSGPVIQAWRTLTFEVPRPAMFFPERGAAFGETELVPLGLLSGLDYQGDRFADQIERSDVKGVLRTRSRWSHKGTYGHALLLAGGVGCHGAALLAARGCFRSGAGLITCHGVEASLAPIRTSLPDVMTSLDKGSDHIDELPDLQRYTAIGIGPGMGATPRLAELLERLLATWAGPLVIDADGLNVLAAHPRLLNMLSPRVVLTPHPKEMDRLLNSSFTSGYDRHLSTKEFAARHRCTVLLKGAYSALFSADGRVYFNCTGNAGMAKGGSGDVLTGLLTGVLAQGYEVLYASMLSMYLHGAAGDLAATAMGQDAMRASDLVDHLAHAWMDLRAR